MKTKHILTALALPAVFAACTAEDIVSENNSLQQDARAKVSKDFVLNTAGEVESRYAVVGSTGLEFVYEEGDLIGANLIDQYEPTKEDPKDWTITPYVAPSLPFKFVGGEQWKSDAELGIGNYLFTYPFNAKDNGRGAAQFELPRVQKYSSADANAIVEDNNKAVGAVVLYEGQTEATAAMKNLYTYPKFVINFDNGVDVKKVTKVILQKGTATANGFVYKGGIHHEVVAQMFKNEAGWVEAKMETSKLTKEEAKAEYWAQFQTSDFIIDGCNPSEIVYVPIDLNSSNVFADSEELAKFGKPERTNFLVVEMDETLQSNPNTDNKSVEVRLMMPSIKDLSALDAEANKLTMHVVTDNGTFAFDLDVDITNGKIVSDGLVFKTDNEAKVKAALSRSSANTLRTKDLTLADKGSDLGNIVTTPEDWNALVEAQKGASKQITVTVLNDEFALTEDLKMPENTLGFKIESPISVAGEVALSNIEASEVIVKKDATLTIGEKFTATTVKVEEGGNLEFVPVLNNDGEVVVYGNSTTGVAGIAAVENKGIVTVKAGALAQFELTNKKDGVLNVDAAASRAADGAGHAYINGTNKGIINNNGIITTTGAFNNMAPAKADGYEYDADADVPAWEGAPTINNKGIFNAKSSENHNHGLFVNEGTLSSDIASTSSFVNTNEKITGETHDYDATLKIGENAKTFIDSNAGGTIVLTKATPANFTIYLAKDAEDYAGTDKTYRGTIKFYATSKSALELDESPVNYVVAEGDVELKTTYAYKAKSTDTDLTYSPLPTLEIWKGGKVKVAPTTKDAAGKDVIAAQVTNMYIMSGDATLDADMNSVSNIIIAKDATLTVPTGKTLTTEIANVSGLGALKVEGAIKISKNSSGSNLVGNTTDGEYDWTTNGSPFAANGIITLGKQAKVYGAKGTVAADLTKQNVMDTAVGLWVKYIGEWEGTTLTTYYGYEATIQKFILTMKEWKRCYDLGGTSAQQDYALAAEAFATAKKNASATTALWGVDYAADQRAANSIESLLMPNGVACAEFVSALATKLATEEAAFDYTWKVEYTGALNFATGKTLGYQMEGPAQNQTHTVFDSKTDAYNVIRKFMATPGNLKKDFTGSDNKTTWEALNDKKLFAAAWTKTDEEVETVLKNTKVKVTVAGTGEKDINANYLYLYNGCDLVEVMQLIKTKTVAEWNSVLFTTSTPSSMQLVSSLDLATVEGMNKWMEAVYNANAGSSMPKDAAVVIYNKYKDVYKKWQYTDKQVKASADYVPVVIETSINNN